MPKRAAGFDSPQLHFVRKCILTRGYVNGHESGEFPQAVNQLSDQGKCARHGRGNVGVTHPPAPITQPKKPQATTASFGTGFCEGGKRADDDTATAAGERCSSEFAARSRRNLAH